MNPIDLSGKTFHRWTVLSRVGNTKQGQAQWLCRCECGTERILKSIVIRRGISQSCGCYKLEVLNKRSTKHGHAPSTGPTPTYHSWVGMVQRCTNPNNRHYQYYGAKGIGVCDRWLSFANFLEDMGEKPPKTSIDRINYTKDYYKENCRWATITIQARNKTNNRILTFNGETKSLAEWSEQLGIKYASLHYRLTKGWSVEKTLSTPIKPK